MHTVPPLRASGKPSILDPTEPGHPPAPEVDPDKAPSESPDTDLPGTPGMPTEDPGSLRPVDDPPPANPDGVPPPLGDRPEIRE